MEPEQLHIQKSQAHGVNHRKGNTTMIAFSIYDLSIFFKSVL